MGTLIDIRSREWPVHSLDSDQLSQSLTNSNPKKSTRWKKTNWLEWRSYLQGSVFLCFPFESGGGWSGSRGGEGGAAPWRSGQVGSGGKKNGRKRKRRLAGWICIRLNHATPHGATQSCQCMWRDSVLSRQARWHACDRVAARSRRNMWRYPPGSRATGLGAIKRASS